MKRQTAFFQEQCGEWLKVEPGIERMMAGYNDHLMMVKVKFEKDAVGVLHSHSHIQVSYIAKGSFKVTIDGKSSILHEGDSFFVESNLVHGVVCIAAGVLIDTFNPCREDFL